MGLLGMADVALPSPLAITVMPLKARPAHSHHASGAKIKMNNSKEIYDFGQKYSKL
jgi:hypothetical protein